MARNTTSSSHWPNKCFQWPFSWKLDWGQGKGRLCIPISHRPLLMWYSKAHCVPLNSVGTKDFKHESKIACAIIWLQKIKEVCYSVATSLSTVHWCWWCSEHLWWKQLSHLLCYTPIKAHKQVTDKFNDTDHFLRTYEVLNQSRNSLHFMKMKVHYHIYKGLSLAPVINQEKSSSRKSSTKNS
jgi:hypothetical protein